MNRTTLVSIVLGIVLTLSAGFMVADMVSSVSDGVVNHFAPLYEVLN